MDNVLVVTDNVLVTLAGPLVPMGQHVLNVCRVSFWTPLVIVQVGFSLSCFLPSNDSQSVSLDVLSVKMERELVLLARRGSPMMQMTQRSAIIRKMLHQGKLYVRLDRSAPAKAKHLAPFVRHLAGLALSQRRTASNAAQDFPRSMASVSPWILMEFVREVME